MVWDFFGVGRTRQRPSKGEKELLNENQKGRCNYCGKKLGLAYLQVDHKKAHAKEGSERITNKQLICGPCNSRKGTKSDGEFRRLYKLTPARQAKGPPTKAIPQSYFEAISKTLKAKKATQRRRAADEWW